VCVSALEWWQQSENGRRRSGAAVDFWMSSVLFFLFHLLSDTRREKETQEGEVSCTETMGNIYFCFTAVAGQRRESVTRYVDTNMHTRYEFIPR